MRSAECGMEVRTSIPHSAFRTPHWSVGVVRLDDFRSLVERLEREIPPEFTGGVVAVDVSPKALPHPVHGDVYTLGECVPLEWSGSGADLHSRIILYHGSFASLARLGGFDWREETWETLTHELRHHLEWRANVDDDVFMERTTWNVQRGGDEVEAAWHGRRYHVSFPHQSGRPLFLTLEGLVDPPPGDAILVVKPAPRLLDLFRRRPATVRGVVEVTPLDG